MATVLIVDDVVVNRQFLTTLLGYEGHRLFEASDGARALALANAVHPDVIITDILMPTMDGYEFVRQLRANPALAGSVVIFYTAHYHGPEAETLAANCGVQHILTKPCEPHLILSTVNLALGKGGPAAAVQAPDFDRAHLQLITDKLSEKAEELARSGERLQALIDVNLQLASERNPQRLLESVGHAARELIGAKYAVIAVGARDKSAIDALITSGMAAEVSSRLVPSTANDGVVDQARQQRKVFRSAGIGHADATTGLPTDHPAFSSLLVAPIVSLSHSYGWLALTDKLGADQFSEEDERLLGILCAQLGRTYENGSLLADLRSSEQRYRSIFDNSVLGIFAINETDQIVSANAALLRMLGYPANHALPPPTERTVRDVYLNPEDQKRFRDQLLAHTVVESFETRWRRQDGSTIWVSLSARLAGHLDGSDISYIGLVEDITERIRLRDALREREAGLAHAQHIAKLAHVITGPDGSFEDWSETLPQLVGVDVELLPRTTRSWMELVHRDDRALFREAAIAAAADRKPTDVRYRLNHGNGEPIYVRQTTEALGDPDANGKSRWFNTIQDISEQKRAEDRINRLNRVYAVLSAINSAIVRLHNRADLFAEACRIAVVEGAFKQAWIGEVDPVTLDGTVVASHGVDQSYVNLIKFSGRPDAPNRERPASRAVRLMKPVVCNDVGSDPAFATLRGELLARGHHALAVFPLIVEGRIEGVLSLHAAEKDFFDDEEVRLLNELAGDVAFALEYISKESQLDYLAYYDALTGLPKSALFRDRLTQLLAHADQDRPTVAVYLIDLERFTQVNDTLGRRTGDILLKLVAERFTKALPKGSSLARISADTFAVAVDDLGEGADASSVFLQAHIFDALTQTFTIDGKELRVTAQAGVALSPADGRDADALFSNAEAALKQAKASDERYLFYAPAMNALVAEKLALERELRTAMETHQFVLHYQPIVELSSGQIVGAEALIRWQHPQHGLLAPARFLAVIEETDMSIPLGAWVMQTACAQVVEWQAAGLPQITISVNLSARQFRDESLVQRVGDALHRTRLEARWLQLELTENIVMHDAERFIAKLNALKALGVKLSLDDFGTGYSSLSYLKRFPLDQLKVDQSFIREVISNTEDAAIVRAVISIGNSMGLELVVEGVETEAQLGWLRQHRCEKIQGYYFSRPVPAAEFRKMLTESKSLPSHAASPSPDGKTLLVVDDESNIVAAVVRLLRREGYRILTANSAAEAFDVLALNPVQVVLSDHRMPGMTGAEFLGAVKGLYPDTVRILFSGYVEIEALTDAVNRGSVYRFLLKPWNDELLRESIREAFHHHWVTHGRGPAASAGTPVLEHVESQTQKLIEAPHT